MIVLNRSAFLVGTLLTLSFFGVLALIFMPLFGEGRNGLQYADDMFNRLSKGSSYFIPKVTKSSAAQAGKPFAIEIRLADAVQAERIAVVLRPAEVQVERSAAGLKLSGDLGRMLALALRDAEDGYHNDAAAIEARHGLDVREVLATWWQLLQQIDKSLKLELRLDEAKAVHEVMKKAIEPAHNYFGIEAEQVRDLAPEMIGLLVFYVLYTMWWGFAIFYLFEGMGLVMKKKAGAGH